MDVQGLHRGLYGHQSNTFEYLDKVGLMHTGPAAFQHREKKEPLHVDSPGPRPQYAHPSGAGTQPPSRNNANYISSYKQGSMDPERPLCATLYPTPSPGLRRIRDQGQKRYKLMGLGTVWKIVWIIIIVFVVILIDFALALTLPYPLLSVRPHHFNTSL
ncbi:hypothetical protein AG1IA_04872 [Rhizoctonia solani AG-1 IA]|uniref:Uncharacterized protein n=1 Tax=Thanatephorus cucumeris (strain AG1-IA) TaxID=983506 RepID=L8WSI2_THACA|nr:hypothetical protein AG1IA_04872 [Rhizoctonia solani AG-1 IA]